MNNDKSIRKSISFDERSLGVVVGVAEKHGAGLSQALRFIVLDWSERRQREERLEDFLRRNPPVQGRALVDHEDEGDAVSAGSLHED